METARPSSLSLNVVWLSQSLFPILIPTPHSAIVHFVFLLQRSGVYLIYLLASPSYMASSGNPSSVESSALWSLAAAKVTSAPSQGPLVLFLGSLLRRNHLHQQECPPLLHRPPSACLSLISLRQEWDLFTLGIDLSTKVLSPQGI